MFFLMPLLLLLAPANAAECYAQSHGSRCVSKSQLLNYAPTWCNRYYKDCQCNWLTYQDSSSNTAYIGKIGNFKNAQVCEDAYRDIVNSCHGSRNGGSWTYGEVSININFCAW